jgi:hypothetical protein
MRYVTIQEIHLGATACGPRLAPLMTALLDLESADGAVCDPDLTADITTGLVEVELTVEAPDPISAMITAVAAVRTAIQTTGGPAPNWETATAAMHVTPEDTAESLLSVA